MADKPTIRVATAQRSNLFNGELVAGAGKGAIVGTVVGMPVVGAVIGAGLASFTKKNEEDNSLAANGKIIKEVKKPTIFNREMLVGTAAVVGSLGVSGLIATAVMGAATVGGIIAAPFTGGLTLAPALVGLAGTAATVAVPTVAGLFGKGRMEKEYALAEEQKQQELAQQRLTTARAGLALNGMNNAVPFQRQQQQTSLAMPGANNIVPYQRSYKNVEGASMANPVKGPATIRIENERAAQQQAVGAGQQV
jgi:hypothetical protein